MSAIIGRKAPEFSLQAVQNGQFKQVGLEDYRKKWLVVFFYPLDFTFVCPTEILAFSDRHDEFRKLGADIIGVSIDSQFTHLAWTERPRSAGGIEGLRYALLADVNKKMARDFGVLNEEAGIAYRGLFIIDPDGVVQHATINNLGVGRSVDETLRVLQAFQHVRDHGEVCPANWQPGGDTMKPDWQKSRQ
jgi:peroxiredoxin 2/4